MKSKPSSKIGAAIVVLALVAGVVGSLVGKKLSNQVGQAGIVVIFLLVAVAVIAAKALFDTRSQRPPPEPMSEDQRKSVTVEQGLTALMVAAADGDHSALKRALESGEDVNARSLIGTTALMYAARNNHLPCVESLLGAGADPGARTPKGATALSFAIGAENREVAALLTKAKALGGANGA